MAGMDEKERTTQSKKPKVIENRGSIIRGQNWSQIAQIRGKPGTLAQ